MKRNFLGHHLLWMGQTMVCCEVSLTSTQLECLYVPWQALWILWISWFPPSRKPFPCAWPKREMPPFDLRRGYWLWPKLHRSIAILHMCFIYVYIYTYIYEQHAYIYNIIYMCVSIQQTQISTVISASDIIFKDRTRKDFAVRILWRLCFAQRDAGCPNPVGFNGLI
jgi:hypothetical protein